MKDAVPEVILGLTLSFIVVVLKVWFLDQLVSASSGKYRFLDLTPDLLK